MRSTLATPSASCARSTSATAPIRRSSSRPSPSRPSTAGFRSRAKSPILAAAARKRIPTTWHSEPRDRLRERNGSRELQPSLGSRSSMSSRSAAANVREIQGKRSLGSSATNDRSWREFPLPEGEGGTVCKGFRMPALCEHAPLRSRGAGIRKPPRKETASRKGAVAGASYGDLCVGEEPRRGVGMTGAVVRADFE